MRVRSKENYGCYESEFAEPVLRFLGRMGASRTEKINTPALRERQ